MEQNSEQPAIPPPDIPKPDIPPPDIPPVPPAPAPVVNVKIREADENADDEGQGLKSAPLNTRIVAALIDILIAAGLQISALWILPSFAERIAWLAAFGYLVARDSLPFLGGQSVGKRAMKLRVVTADDAPITGKWESALIRNAPLLIPFFGLIELIVLLTREDKPEHGKRLGDEWAKTRVIEVPHPAPAETETPSR